MLNQHQSCAITQQITVTGMGGIGKSQLAAYYAYHYHKEYDLVYWINAECHLLDELRRMGKALQLKVATLGRHALLHALKEKLSQIQNWLIIFDNIEETTELESFSKLFYPQGPDQKKERVRL